MKMKRLWLSAGICCGFVCALPAGWTVLPVALAQSSQQAGIRGTITDSSGAVLAGAQVTITNVGTAIAEKAVSDSRGSYAFTALGASNYTMDVTAPNFGRVEKTGIVLTVNQQTTLNFELLPSSQQTTVNVQAVPVLLDADNATLGADIGSQYLTQVPLANRDPFGLTFLAAGVTETAGSGIDNSYPAGTNFISNGQRNSTADIRLDGNLLTAPEQGEGGTTNVYYQATVEALQEVKVQNNGVSAEYGSSGGTVIDEVMKSGTNQLHGSAYLFNQNAIYDARDYFNSGPKPDHSQYQGGFSIGGPIQKGKTFFFGDLESVRSSNPINILATVPTAAEQQGDFSQSINAGDLYDPFLIDPVTLMRPMYANSQIPAGEIDPVGQAILKLYPAPNTPGTGGANNYRKVILTTAKVLQYDAKVDHHFSDKSILSTRFSNVIASGNTPTVFGDYEYNDGLAYTDRVYNVGLNYVYTPTANTVWTSTFGLDRVSEPGHSNYPSPTVAGFPGYLIQNGVKRFPGILLEDSPWTSIYDQSSTDTAFAHTLLDYASAFAWTKGKQTLKAGGEQRIFYNNFFQPSYPNGFFSFAQHTTACTPYNTTGSDTCPIANPNNTSQGNGFATVLLGYGDPGGSGINVSQSVADRSGETAFYGQDDWRITRKLTLNLGVRYQWSTPYTERRNNNQFSDFNGDSGISVDGFAGTLKGTTVFASSGNRHIAVDRNNVAPRLGFAYLVNDTLVVRGGAGVYYGLGVATNFQYPGPSYTSSPQAFFTTDGFVTRSATLSDPFPGGIRQPQGNRYGKLAMWGLSDKNDTNTGTARNAEIYQWNLGLQQSFPGGVVLGLNYSASRSTHLPWGGYNSTSNRNFIASSIRRQHNSNDLAAPVSNPFQGLFNGPNAIFNEPESQYGNDTIPLINLLRPYPQFDGAYQGLPLLTASSSYNAMQVVFQKRQGKYLNFEGNYTWSKNMDNSSTGFNAFVGTLNAGNPQELDNLRAEWSVSGNDATNRLVAAVVFTLPVGRGNLIGGNMNRAVDAFVGGWQLTTLATYQTGQPLPVTMGNARIADGNQRPSVTCAKGEGLSTGISIHKAAQTQQPWLNASCFADPGDQQPGNAPRYFSNLRADSIHNGDLTLEKQYSFGEKFGHLEVHADCFNCSNTARFGIPDTGFGNSTFGLIGGSAAGSQPRHMQLGARYQF